MSIRDAEQVNNESLQKKIDQLIQELNAAYEDALRGWSQALDLRDHETNRHSQRTTELAVRLGRQMTLDEATIGHLRRGAMLHDVGKMGIPDSILLKPGTLNDAEWAIMRKHPQYGSDMLRGIDYLQPAAEVVYSHHEKWDGSGYPSGLKGAAIPRLARIFAIIEVYDSLASDVPYRPAWPKERILRHLREQSGKAFDPQVVEAFMKMME